MDGAQNESHGTWIAAVFATDAIIAVITLYSVLKVGLSSISSDGSLAGQQSGEGWMLAWGGVVIATLAASAFWSCRKKVLALVIIQGVFTLLACYLEARGVFA